MHFRMHFLSPLPQIYNSPPGYKPPQNPFNTKLYEPRDYKRDFMVFINGSEILNSLWVNVAQALEWLLRNGIITFMRATCTKDPTSFILHYFILFYFIQS